MTRGLIVKFVMGGLVTLAAVDAAQAGRRSRRNNCCCDSSSVSGSRSGTYGYGGSSYAYNTPMNTSMYANNNCQPAGTMPVMGSTAAPPYVSGYIDPNTMTPSGGTLTADKSRLRLQVPTPDTRIWINQHQLQSTGIERSIDVPFSATSPQKVTVTAQWMKDGREVVRKKEVEIRAGQEASVSFTDADALSPGEQIQTSPNGTPDLNRTNPDKP